MNKNIVRGERTRIEFLAKRMTNFAYITQITIKLNDIINTYFAEATKLLPTFNFFLVHGYYSYAPLYWSESQFLTMMPVNGDSLFERREKHL